MYVFVSLRNKYYKIIKRVKWVWVYKDYMYYMYNKIYDMS